MAEVDEIQKQLQALQHRLNEVVEKKKDEEEVQYKGANVVIKLLISNKEFTTKTHTLFNTQHGNTLFLQTFFEKNQVIEEGINENEDNKSQQSKPKIIAAKTSCLDFDRDSDLFSYVLSYLRGYNVQHQLRELSVVQLEKLQNDAVYYKIKPFYNVVTGALFNRFDPYLGSPLNTLTNNSTVLVREAISGNLWQSTAIYGVLSGTITRYVEINIVTHGDRHIMLGVTEARPFKIASYPGGTMSGCSYYGNNGTMYIGKSSAKAWGKAFTSGDRIGALVKLNKESNMATIAFYQNGVLQKEEANLKNFMDVDKGVLFVVGLYTANDRVQLVQNPVIPQ